jgi:hypothetical protein
MGREPSPSLLATSSHTYLGVCGGKLKTKISPTGAKRNCAYRIPLAISCGHGGVDGESVVLPAVGGYVAPAVQPVNAKKKADVITAASTNGDVIRCI